MSYDVDDVIAAVASAPGGAARGIVRLAGPRLADCLAQCFVADDGAASLDAAGPARRIAGTLRISESVLSSPWNLRVDLWWWPHARSYCRQPTAEIHVAGSPPLLAAAVEQLCRCGARAAQPGEFTLRAFLAGRVDLVQAESVIGVVDARGQADFAAALEQLAGGLTRPLHQVRSDLLDALADLEAGLDFSDEDISFIGRQALAERLDDAARLIAEAEKQLAERRSSDDDAPRIVLAGPPNSGKSSLYNALGSRHADRTTPAALVSPVAGSTRDCLAARLRIGDQACVLVDVPGNAIATDFAADSADPVAAAAQHLAERQHQLAELRLVCFAPGTDPPSCGPGELAVRTKSDLDRNPPGHATTTDGNAGAPGVATQFISCSSLTGEGLDELTAAIARELTALDAARTTLAAGPTLRCTQSLRAAGDAVARAQSLAVTGGEELIAAEMRVALAALGDVVGVVCTDDLLDRVFSKFCIGK